MPICAEDAIRHIDGAYAMLPLLGTVRVTGMDFERSDTAATVEGRFLDPHHAEAEVTWADGRAGAYACCDTAWCDPA